MMTISVITGSTRHGLFSEKPAQWSLHELRKREGTEARLLDLRDFPMPSFDQHMPPAMPGRPPYEYEVVKKWTAEIALEGAFDIVTGEVERLGGWPPKPLRDVLARALKK